MWKFSLSWESVAAIYRSVVLRLEGNLGVFSAGSAYSVKHLAVCSGTGSAAACFALAGCAAILATGGFVCESLFSVEVLFACCEFEACSAVSAGQCFVLSHEICLPHFIICWPCSGFKPNPLLNKQCSSWAFKASYYYTLLKIACQHILLNKIINYIFIEIIEKIKTWHI